MAKIVTVEQMRAIEKAADASGLTYDRMMQNAGRAVAETILRRASPLQGKRVGILVGVGNNGGDGLVAGHHLLEAGAQVAVYLARERGADDANLTRLRDRGVLIAIAQQDQRSRVLRNIVTTSDVLIDALLGTGARLPLQGEVKEILEVSKNALAGRGKLPYVVALDCPSGLDCDTGHIAPEAMRADLTVTLAAAKPGLLTFPGAEAVGELVVADIGIPPDQKEVASVDLELASADSVRGWLPLRPRHAHKGTFGTVVVVAGSVNFPGAAALAALGAYRAGAGLVTLAAPAPIQPLVAPQVPEATWILLPHEMGVIAEGASDVLAGSLGDVDAVLIGPGFGQESETASFLARLLGVENRRQAGSIGFVHSPGEGAATPASLPPMVVDADGLKLLTRIEGWPARLPPQSVLTPHPGEMSILTEEAVETIQADRVEISKRWAAKWGHVVLLKGAFTVVAAPDGQATVLPFATPALARAGTGDVLAGVVAGLRAQGLDGYKAAVLGAYLHGRAGELAAEVMGHSASVLAGDVADALSSALAEIGGPERSP